MEDMMREILLDGNRILTPELLHDCLERELELPEYYGRNLDALYDVLEESCKKYQFRIQNYKAFCEHLGRYAQSFLQVLEDAGCYFISVG